MKIYFIYIYKKTVYIYEARKHKKEKSFGSG